MPTESSGASTPPLVEAEEAGAQSGSERSFDARLGPGCMLWFMIIGLGFFIGMILVWMVGHVGAIFS